MTGLYIQLQQTFQKCPGCDGLCGSKAVKSYPSPKVGAVMESARL